MPRTAIVLTTIFDLDFLPALVSNLDRYGRAEDSCIIIIPDRKSPPSSWEKARAWGGRGVTITYPTLEEQDSYLDRVPEINGLLPYDSANRRNIGSLMA